MKIIFAGSPAFAVPSLKCLLATEHDIVCVVTQPARPAGRGLVMRDPPVKLAALEAGLPAFQPEKFNAPDFLAVLAGFEPDLVVTAAYGRIFKRRALGLPRLGCVNLHASLLPRYRGVAPINWVIINGEGETGVSTFFMEEGVDTGEIIMARSTAIGENETAGELTERLAAIGAELLVETCGAIAAGNAPRTRQDSTQACYAPRLAKEDGRVSWEKDAAAIHNRIRGVTPWPGAFCGFRGQTLKLVASRLPCARDGESRMAAPGEGRGAGTVIGIDSDRGVLVSCGSGSIWLAAVQAQGKKATRGADFARGYRIKIGDLFG